MDEKVSLHNNSRHLLHYSNKLKAILIYKMLPEPLVKTRN